MQAAAELMKSLNWLDIMVLIIMGLCMTGGYAGGLIKSVFNLFSSVIAIIVSRSAYPVASRILRENLNLHDYIKEIIISGLNISGYIKEQTVFAQKQFIESLSVPGFLTQNLLSNNNTEIYKFFNVETVEDYVATYISNMVVNFIAMILVFFITMTILKLISKSLGIVKKLPVIGTIDRLGGLACGIASGTILIWFLFAVSALFFMQPFFANVLETAETSKVAVFFYDNNLIMDMIMKINI